MTRRHYDDHNKDEEGNDAEDGDTGRPCALRDRKGDVKIDGEYR